MYRARYHTLFAAIWRVRIVDVDLRPFGIVRVVVAFEAAKPALILLAETQSRFTAALRSVKAVVPAVH